MHLLEHYRLKLIKQSEKKSLPLLVSDEFIDGAVTANLIFECNVSAEVVLNYSSRALAIHGIKINGITYHYLRRMMGQGIL